MFLPIFLLFVSNIFMTFAWYGHLKTMQEKSLFLVIVVSWAIAFFEYCFQVPANRLGAKVYSVPQLKVMQEIITMTVFAGFYVFFMKQPLTKNYLWATLCLILAAFFIFRDLK
jgi:hypothetical protein